MTSDEISHIRRSILINRQLTLTFCEGRSLYTAKVVANILRIEMFRVIGKPNAVNGKRISYGSCAVDEEKKRRMMMPFQVSKPKGKTMSRFARIKNMVRKQAARLFYKPVVGDCSLRFKSPSASSVAEVEKRTPVVKKQVSFADETTKYTTSAPDEWTSCIHGNGLRMTIKRTNINKEVEQWSSSVHADNCMRMTLKRVIKSPKTSVKLINMPLCQGVTFSKYIYLP